MCAEQVLQQLCILDMHLQARIEALSVSLLEPSAPRNGELLLEISLPALQQLRIPPNTPAGTTLT